MIAIKHIPSEDQKDFEHLHPIVEYLLNNGNETCSDFIWGQNRTGYFCHLKYKINFDLLLSNFRFPETIKIDEENQIIDCLNTYTIIRGDAC